MNEKMKMPMNMVISKEQKKLMHDIGVVDFVIIEMVEYLDTHPYDKEGIDYVGHYIKIKNQLMKDYAKKYYPLCLSDADTCNNEWKWALQPLPWEGECY